MAEKRKILVSLPASLLKEVDSIVSIEKTNRSEFIRKAARLYIRERKKIQAREKLIKGYQEMAEINLEIAEEFFDIDNELQQYYERRLAECE